MKIWKPLWSLLWRSIICGLGFMMIALLILNIFSLSWYTPDTFPESLTWKPETITEFSTYKGYPPSYAFPLFPALYTPLEPIYLQFLMQCIGCIAAAAGVVVALYIIRKEDVSIWIQLLAAPLSALTGFVPLLLQLRIHKSRSDMFWIPFLILLSVGLLTALNGYKRKQDIERINGVLSESRDSRRAHLFALAPFDYVSMSYSVGTALTSAILYTMLAFFLWNFVVEILGGIPNPLFTHGW